MRCEAAAGPRLEGVVPGFHKCLDKTYLLQKNNDPGIYRAQQDPHQRESYIRCYFRRSSHPKPYKLLLVFFFNLAVRIDVLLKGPLQGTTIERAPETGSSELLPVLLPSRFLESQLG